MLATRQIPRSKLHVINSPVKKPANRLTSDDIARLNSRRSELIVMLRDWHGYGQARAETEINLWLRDHS